MIALRRWLGSAAACAMVAGTFAITGPGLGALGNAEVQASIPKGSFEAFPDSDMGHLFLANWFLDDWAALPPSDEPNVEPLVAASMTAGFNIPEPTHFRDPSGATRRPNQAAHRALHEWTAFTVDVLSRAGVECTTGHDTCDVQGPYKPKMSLMSDAALSFMRTGRSLRQAMGEQLESVYGVKFEKGYRCTSTSDECAKLGQHFHVFFAQSEEIAKGYVPGILRPIQPGVEYRIAYPIDCIRR